MDCLRGLAERQHGVVSCAQALAAGRTKSAWRHLVASGDWAPMGRGVMRLVGTKHTHHQLVMAAVLAAGPSAVASHRTAAWLLGFPGFGTWRTEVCRPATRSGRGAFGDVHRSGLLPPDHTTVIDGIACTTAARTLFDLAGSVPPQRCARALDNALSSRAVSFPVVVAVLLALGQQGRPGTQLFRELVDARGPRYVAPASELEALVLGVLAANGLLAPARQVDLGSDAEWIGRVDFCFREQGVVLEADGLRYHSSLLDQQADRQRQARLEAEGWRVLRVTWHELVGDPIPFLDRLRDALAARAA